MAIISVNCNRPIGRIDPLIYGQFIEHMQRCLYGGIYEEESPLSDERGFRLDVLEKIRSLQTPILRWPGGNFVSGYHWEDGIGPKARRPRRLELAWPQTPRGYGTEESNRFGTDEFIAYCRELATEPYICINLGTGSLDEARNWLEYCNGAGNTYYANLRRQNGHADPYNVKYWGLGNEMYGAWQQGAKSAQEYATYAREAAKLLKWVDPSIKLIACGHDGLSEWEPVVLETLAPLVDYYSIHIYTGSLDYHTNVFLPHHAERALRHMAALIEGVRYRKRLNHPIRIAYDEWNVWNTARATAANGYEDPYTLADALAVATYLNLFQRLCNVVGMANLAQTVNVLGAIITSPAGSYVQTIYHPLRLYRALCGSVALDCYIASGANEQYAFSEQAPPTDLRVTGLGPFHYLDVSASSDPETGTVTLCVVNRHPEQPIVAQLNLLGGEWGAELAIYEINAASVAATNSFAQPDAVTVQRTTWRPGGLQPTYAFPAHSITILKT